MTHLSTLATLWTDPAFAAIPSHKREGAIRAHIAAHSADRPLDASVTRGSDSAEARAMRARERAERESCAGVRGQIARGEARNALAVLSSATASGSERLGATIRAEHATETARKADHSIASNPTRADRPVADRLVTARNVSHEDRALATWRDAAIRSAPDRSGAVALARASLPGVETRARGMVATARTGHVKAVDGTIRTLDAVERASLVEGASALVTAARLAVETAERTARLECHGAPLATIREEARRATGGDRRRGNVRPDGSIVLPGDSDYTVEADRKAAIGRAPVEPGGVRLNPATMRVSSVDDGAAWSRYESSQNKGVALADSLAAKRAQACSDLTSAVRTRSTATNGAARKAATSHARAVSREWSHDPAFRAVAATLGWAL